MTDWREQDHPRHPAGSDRGGEFRRQFLFETPADRWLARVEAQFDPFSNDTRGREELHRRVTGTDTVVVSDLSGGQTAVTNRWRFEDGVSIVRKQFGEPEDYDDDEDSFISDKYSDEQVQQALAEVKASLVAAAVGASALTVIPDPDGHPATIYYGFRDGLPPQSGAQAKAALKTDQAVLLGVLDLLIANEDRSGANWLIASDGTPVGIDHAQSFDGLGWLVDHKVVGGASSPFAMRLYRDAWLDNRLHPDDIEVIRRQLEDLRHDWLTDGELAYMGMILDELAKHAKGDRRLVA